MCPACAQSGYLKKHCVYEKYYYQERIKIQRVRCGHCKVTHAIIPSFSLPGTGSGTKEAEDYLQNREKGQSRKQAAKVFEGKGLSDSYPKQLERMLKKAIIQAKALLTMVLVSPLKGLDWIRFATGKDSRPLYELNCFCLSNQVNAICFNRVSILKFRYPKTGSNPSLKDPSPRLGKNWLNSS